MKVKDLEKLVLEWADEKDLLHEENTEKQFMKFIEEVFEFKTEMDNYDFNIGNLKKFFYRKMKIEMGDIFVTLIILCKQLGVTPSECLELAYKKISKRKGKTINGIFVKEEDLKDVEE